MNIDVLDRIELSCTLVSKELWGRTREMFEDICLKLLVVNKSVCDYDCIVIDANKKIDFFFEAGEIIFVNTNMTKIEIDDKYMCVTYNIDNVKIIKLQQ